MSAIAAVPTQVHQVLSPSSRRREAFAGRRFLAMPVPSPGQRFVVVPLVVVALYAVTIVMLESRWWRLQHTHRDDGGALAVTT